MRPRPVVVLTVVGLEQGLAVSCGISPSHCTCVGCVLYWNVHTVSSCKFVVLKPFCGDEWSHDPSARKIHLFITIAHHHARSFRSY